MRFSNYNKDACMTEFQHEARVPMLRITNP